MKNGDFPWQNVSLPEGMRKNREALRRQTPGEIPTPLRLPAARVASVDSWRRNRGLTIKENEPPVQTPSLAEAKHGKNINRHIYTIFGTIKVKKTSKIWHPIFISNSPFFTGSSWVQSHTPCSGQPMCVYGYQGRRDIRTLGMNLPENIWQKEVPKFNLCRSWKYGQLIPRVQYVWWEKHLRVKGSRPEHYQGVHIKISLCKTYTKNYIEHCPFIVDLPMKDGDFNRCFLYVHHWKAQLGGSTGKPWLWGKNKPNPPNPNLHSAKNIYIYTHNLYININGNISPHFVNKWGVNKFKQYIPPVYAYIYIPIGSMYGIYANIWGVLMVNVIIYSIHGSYGIYIYVLRGHEVRSF